MGINENIKNGMKRYRVALSYVALDEQNGSLVHVDTFAFTPAQAVERALHNERPQTNQLWPLQAIEVYELNLVSIVKTGA